MTVSPDEAADTLRDIAATERHSHRLYGYRQASPHLIQWGVLWIVGYGLATIWPQLRGPIWATLVAIGFVAGFAIVLRSHSGVAGLTRTRPRIYWRFPAIAATALTFIFASIAVMSPVSPRQIDAFIPLVVAAGYTLLSLWIGVRFLAVGIALAALTLGGFFLLPTHFELWMAAVGGGALVLGGLWLRGA